MSLTLTDLLAVEGAPVEDAALLVAKDLKPALSVPRVLAELDALAAPLAGPIAAASTTESRTTVLLSHFSGGLAFKGNEDDYYDPRNSFLDDVIERRLGIPLTLTIAFVAIARRVGVVAEGIGFPGHFLCRVGGESGIYVDLFSGGRFLEKRDLDALATRYLGDASYLRADHLAAASTTSIVVRMLTNLKQAYARRGDFAHALLACDRLVDLTGAPEARRDRGLLSARFGSFAGAVDDLVAYLDLRPEARDRAQVSAILATARAKAPGSLQ